MVLSRAAHHESAPAAASELLPAAVWTVLDALAGQADDVVVILRTHRAEADSVQDVGPSLVWFNDAAADALGLTRDDLDNREWFRAPFSQNGELWSSLLTMLRDGTVARARVPFVTHRRELRQWHLTLTPMALSGVSVRHWCLAAHDVGDAADVGQKGQDAESLRHNVRSQHLQTLGEMTRSVAHDFGNLVHLIGGYTQLALQSASRDDAIASMQVVQEAAERAGAMVKTLTRFGHDEQLAQGPVDLRELLQRDAPLLERLAGPRVRVAWSSTPSAYPPVVWGSEVQFEQVLFNLVVNARDAQPEGGRVSIELRVERLERVAPVPAMAMRVSHVVRLCVRDEGPGIPPSLREQVLDPFYTTKPHGTGLGLSTVHHIVQQSGGTLRLVAARGGGLAVDMVLPLHIA